MAWRLCVVADGGSEKTRKAVAILLGRDGRPDFPEDVPAEHHEACEAIQWLDYPERTLCVGDQLYLEWADSETQLGQVVGALGRIGIEIPAAYVVPDEPMSLDVSDDADEPFEGYFFVLVEGELERATERTLGQYFPGKTLPELDPHEPERTLSELASVVRG